VCTVRRFRPVRRADVYCKAVQASEVQVCTVRQFRPVRCAGVYCNAFHVLYCGLVLKVAVFWFVVPCSLVV
jgi:hypothetical protein